MFTGLIEDIGVVTGLSSKAGARSISISTRLELEKGESIAVNGVCLTATETLKEGFSCDIGPETLRTTTLGSIRRDVRVNLETAAKLGDPMGGHLVTGHIDGTATITSVRKDRSVLWVDLRLTPDLIRYVLSRGSICIDGVSLTVAKITGNLVRVMLIPETQRSTIASGYRTGTIVNVEVDILAKMLEKTVGRDGGKITESYLEEQGY
jgi:riboflavin synthase